MTPDQATQLLQLMADSNEWLSQIATHLYWLNTVWIPLIGLVMLFWVVYKRFMDR